MRLKALVFDFDGTLVDSNACKHNAFYELFPDKPAVRKVIEEVLSEMGAQSRYVIFPELLRRLRPVFPMAEPEQSAEYIEQYRKRVVVAQQAACEMPGAGESLRALSERYPLYLSTITPQEDIEYLLKARNWACLFRKVFGYPNDKIKVLHQVMQTEKADQTEVIMIGDGAGDRAAAEQVGCPFEPAGGNFSFEIFTRRLLKE